MTTICHCRARAPSQDARPLPSPAVEGPSPSPDRHPLTDEAFALERGARRLQRCRPRVGPEQDYQVPEEDRLRLQDLALTDDAILPFAYLLAAARVGGWRDAEVNLASRARDLRDQATKVRTP